MNLFDVVREVAAPERLWRAARRHLCALWRAHDCHTGCRITAQAARAIQTMTN